MSAKTRKLFADHVKRTGRANLLPSDGATFRDAVKLETRPKSGAIADMIADGNRLTTTGCPECDEEIRTGRPCPVMGAHSCDDGSMRSADEWEKRETLGKRSVSALPPPTAQETAAELRQSSRKLRAMAEALLFEAESLNMMAERLDPSL